MCRILILALFLAPATLLGQAIVPFVGCPSDGQVGPLPPPQGKTKSVNLASNIAIKLAYYKAENGPGVLGPRGWHCFSTYGSNGSSLFVTPQQLSSKNFFHEPAILFTSPAIQLSTSIGDTSGRFEVAKIIARLFPAHRQFATDVLNEHLLIDTLPDGPFPTDRLRYLSNEAVEYTTPAEKNGEGTSSFLAPTNQPITGVVLLTGEELSAIHLSVRLALHDAPLALFMTHQLEQEASTHE